MNDEKAAVKDVLISVLESAWLAPSGEMLPMIELLLEHGYLFRYMEVLHLTVKAVALLKEK